MSEDKTTRLRDFVYLDVERMYSLYSQVFEGLAEQIEKSRLEFSATSDHQKGPLFGGSAMSANAAEASIHTESIVLHDHMYNRLEDRMCDLLIDGGGLRTADFREHLKLGSLIKVTGAAEIEDYSRAGVFLSKFNRIAEAIAHSLLSAGAFNETVGNLKRDLQAATDRTAKQRLRQEINSIEDPKRAAKELGLAQDETMLGDIALFIETFYADGFGINLSPIERNDVVFRGIVDRRWLRIQPELLRAMYGGVVEDGWTMVGQVTFLPGGRQDDDQTETASAAESGDETPSMRDPMKAMLRAMRGFERMFLESKSTIEILVRPIAVYGELVPVSKA